MGLKDTLENERIGREAKAKEIADANRTAGIEQGAQFEQRRIANELRNQALAEAEMQKQKQQMQEIYRAGTQRGAQAVVEQLDPYNNMSPQMQAQAEASQAPQNEIGPIEQNGVTGSEEAMDEAMARILDAQQQGATPEQIQALFDKEPEVVRKQIFGLMQDQQLNNGSMQANPTVIRDQNQSTANRTKDQILQEMMGQR